jgi:hypothetical protein
MKTVPITILADDRESAPYTFSDMVSRPVMTDGLTADEVHELTVRYDVTVIRQRLLAGDYSLPGATNLVAVERKTLEDLYGTLTDPTRRNRFRTELGVMNAMARPGGLTSAVVLVEEDWREGSPPEHPYYRVIPDQVERLRDEFPSVAWEVPGQPGRRGAEVAAFLFLLGWHERITSEMAAR